MMTTNNAAANTGLACPHCGATKEFTYLQTIVRAMPIKPDGLPYAGIGEDNSDPDEDRVICYTCGKEFPPTDEMKKAVRA